MNVAQRKTMRQLIKTSVWDFNKFREENPDVTIEISNSTFNDLNLSGINLSGCGLGMCRFIGAKLDGADLSNTQLHSANFTQAKMRNVKLDGAHVFKTDFTGADLRNASLNKLQDLIETKFFSCDLRGANFGETKINAAMIYKSKVDSTAFTGTLTGTEMIKSRVNFLLPMVITFMVIIGLVFGSWYVYLMFNLKGNVSPADAMNASILYQQGLLEYKSGNFNLAGEKFQEAIKLNPGEPKYLLGMGDVLSAGDKHREALNTYKKGLKEARKEKLKEEFQKRIDSYK